MKTTTDLDCRMTDNWTSLVLQSEFGMFPTALDPHHIERGYVGLAIQAHNSWDLLTPADLTYSRGHIDKEIKMMRVMNEVTDMPEWQNLVR